MKWVVLSWKTSKSKFFLLNKKNLPKLLILLERLFLIRGMGKIWEKILPFFLGRVIKKTPQKTVQRQRFPKVTVWNRPAVQKKKIPVLKNLLPFRKKIRKIFFLKTKTSQNYFKPNFPPKILWWHPHTSQRQLTFTSETDVILSHKFKIKELCLFRQTLWRPFSELP